MLNAVHILTKICVKCGLQKSLSEFHKYKQNLDGYKTECKPCRKLVRKINWDKDYYTRRNWQLKSSFGITLKQYNQFFLSQRGCCAICEVHQGSLNKALAVDHNHNTGQIRGLLCGNCNSAIGKLKESKDLLLKSIQYLERYK